MRHKITPAERGHRPPLSAEEPTEIYTLRVVRSTRRKLLAAGTKRVRLLLDEFARSRGE